MVDKEARKAIRTAWPKVAKGKGKATAVDFKVSNRAPPHSRTSAYTLDLAEGSLANLDLDLDPPTELLRVRRVYRVKRPMLTTLAYLAFYLTWILQPSPASAAPKRKRAPAPDMFEIQDPEAESSSTSTGVDISVAQLDFGTSLTEGR